jgi:hypothetical protein
LRHNFSNQEDNENLQVRLQESPDKFLPQVL